MTTELISQEQLEAQIKETIENHSNVIVADDPGYIAAQEALKVIKGRQKQVNGVFDPLVKSAHETHKALTTKRGEFLKPLQAVYASISRQCSTYNQAKEAEARRLQEIENDRLRKEAEDQKIKDAEVLEETGQTEEAERVLDEPVNVAPAPLKSAPIVENVSYRENWKFTIDNRELIPREFMVPDEKKIGQYVRAMKEAANIKGVRIYVEKTPIVR